MSTIIVLTGANGAGKTTIADWMQREGIADRVKTFTTRPKRFPGEDEYHFFPAEKPPGDAEVAWRITRDPYQYGMLKSDISSVSPGHVGVTVFDPEQLHVLRRFRDNNREHEIVIVALDTISDTAELVLRVGNDSRRLLSSDRLNNIKKTLRLEDICLTGDLPTIQAAIFSICSILTGRGGLVTASALSPLLQAGSLLASSDIGQLQTASYDLRVGNEVWCQGRFIDLDDKNDRFTIPPYSYAIVKAKETAQLPSFMSATFDIKVSHFLSGVILSNGPQVDPGYKGDLFCMLFNGSSAPRDLRLADHFSTIQFFTTTRNSPRYAGPYSFRDKLRNSMPTSAAAGPGGAIFSRIDGAIIELKKEQKGFQSLMLTMLAIMSAVALVATGFAFTATATAFSQGQEAVKSANQASMLADRLKQLEIELKDKSVDRDKSVDAVSSGTHKEAEMDKSAGTGDVNVVRP